MAVTFSIHMTEGDSAYIYLTDSFIWGLKNQPLLTISLVVMIFSTFDLCTAHILIGYSMGWSSPVLDKLMDSEQTPLSEVITAAEVSWVASLFMAGLVIGPILFGILPNIIGRKPCIMISSLSTMLGYILLAVGLDTIWIYSGQFIKGVGISATVVINCIYIGEFASSSIRGTIMAAMNVFNCLGILLVYSVGPYVSYRDISYVAIAINVVHLLFCGYYIPESPVYHAITDNEDAAKKVLQELGRGKDIETELKTMIATQEQDNSVNNFKRFTIRSNWMALIINIVLQCLTLGAGVLCVLFYASIIFKAAASSVAPEISTIILGATQLAGAILTRFYIDKFGRKTLLLLSFAVSSIFLAILGVYFYLELIKYSFINSIRWLPLFALVSYLFSISFGSGVVSNTILGETFQPSMRSVGSAIAVTCSGLAGLASTTSFSHIVSTLGNHSVFWIYAGINVFGFFFTLFVVPETKGKSLMEIQAMLRGKGVQYNIDQNAVIFLCCW